MLQNEKGDGVVELQVSARFRNHSTMTDRDQDRIENGISKAGASEGEKRDCSMGVIERKEARRARKRASTTKTRRKMKMLR